MIYDKRPAPKAELEERIRAITGIEGDAEIAHSTFAAVTTFEGGQRVVSYVKCGGVPNDVALLPDAPPSAPDASEEPEHHFADLMLADETVDDAKVRLSLRLRELRHYLIAPEIKVNEDGSVGLTAGEQSELQDLERRQTLGRWLEA